MNKLQQLIQELCPDGVEWKTLETVSKLITKQTGFDYTKYIKVRLISENEVNSVPYVQTKFFTGKIFNYETDYFVPSDIVQQFPKITLDEKCILFSIVGASIGNVGLFPGTVKCFLGGAICVMKLRLGYNADYIYYCVESEKVQRQIQHKTKGVGQATITVEDIRNFQIPVPPLAIQNEIVRILDKFSTLTAELQAELQARKSQYEYYRNQLLDYSKGEVEWKTLNNIAENLDSMRKPVTSGSREEGDIPYYGASGIVDYVKNFIFDGDFLLISEDGANLIARSTPIAFSISGKSWVNNHAHVLKFGTYAERRFVEYYLNSIDLTPYISGAAQPKLNQKSLNSIQIPIPPLSEQARIVSILDKFDCSPFVA